MVSMSKPVTIKHKTAEGSLYTATFNPEVGMNLMSLKKDKIEAIDQSTRPLFEERCAGLGALIGPHFHNQRDDLLPPHPQ